MAKKLPLIPHVGIRVHGVEYFYSDHIEYRTVPVMEEMLGDRPQVSIDLGPAAQSEEEVRATLAELDSEWEAKDYHVFDKNCVHFADALGAKVAPAGVPRPLLQGVLDVSERMLDSLPDWRRKLGRRVMNEVTRLVVVSWGKASTEKKEAAADKLASSAASRQRARETGPNGCWCPCVRGSRLRLVSWQRDLEKVFAHPCAVLAARYVAPQPVLRVQRT